MQLEYGRWVGAGCTSLGVVALWMLVAERTLEIIYSNHIIFQGNLFKLRVKWLLQLIISSKLGLKCTYNVFISRDVNTVLPCTLSMWSDTVLETKKHTFRCQICEWQGWFYFVTFQKSSFHSCSRFMFKFLMIKVMDRTENGKTSRNDEGIEFEFD